MNLKLISSIFFLSALSNLSQAKDLVFAGQDFPPFNYEENKVITGGMVEVINEVCIQLKHNCKFQIVPVARAIKLLEEGEVDGVLSLNPNAERESFSTASVPIISANIVYMTATENKAVKITNIQELAGWTVVGVRASTVINLAKQHQAEVKSLTIVEESDYKAAIKRLKNKQYGSKAVVVGTEPVLNYFANHEKVGLDVVYVIKETSFITSFGKKKITTSELQAFNKTIKELKDNGKMKAILDKYQLQIAK